MRSALTSATLVVVMILGAFSMGADAQSRTYAQLLTLFQDWRVFEEPPRLNGGVPDYTSATHTRRLADLSRLQERLRAIDTTGWTIQEQVHCAFLGTTCSSSG